MRHSREKLDDAHQAKVLTEHEARRIASNIAKLPDLLGKVWPEDNIQAVSNLSDERHEAEDTTPKGDAIASNIVKLPTLLRRDG